VLFRSHKCNEARLPSSLRRSVHYFMTPMSRMDSDSSKDRKSFAPTTETDNSNESAT